MKIPVIVVAGGVGQRALAPKPKQYMTIGKEGKPILYYTLKYLQEALVEEVILVIDLSYKDFMEAFLTEMKIMMKITIVAGGKDRRASVESGLKALKGNPTWVGIHDGVRPFVSPELIKRLEDRIEAMEAEGCDYVLPLISLKDTIKELTPEQGLKTKDRSVLYGAGTPQIVRLSKIKEALKKGVSGTDEGEILEKIGSKGLFVDNDEENFKITTPRDFRLANLTLEIFEER